MKRLLIGLGCCWLAWSSVADSALIARATTWTDGQVLTHSALNTEFDEAFDEINGNLNAANLAATLTMADGDFLDFSASNASSTTDGIRLPQATSCTSATAEGQLCWDSDDDQLRIGGGSAIGDWNMPDASIEDASPQLIFRDTTGNDAYLIHVDTAASPWGNFAIFRGTKSSATASFSVTAGGLPLLAFDNSNNILFPNRSVSINTIAAPSNALDVYGTIRTGADGRDGQLIIYSDEVSGSDQSVTINPSLNMTQDVTYRLPPDDGTASQFLQTDGSGVLTWAAAGAGDVTDVGPGCATGACYTSGVVTTGTSFAVWEGTSDDASDYTITVPSNPTASLAFNIPEQIVKAWAHWDISGGAVTLADNFNVSSITDNGVGDFTVNWDTDFATANNACLVASTSNQTRADTVLAATCRVICTNSSGTAEDPVDAQAAGIGNQTGE